MIAETVIILFSLLLIGLGLLSFARPAGARRFFGAFASSGPIHYAEQAARLLLGIALVAHASSMWQSGFFRILGWLIVATSVGLCLMPWRWHRRFAEQVVPPVLRHLTLYALALITFAVLLLFGVFRGSAGEAF